MKTQSYEYTNHGIKQTVQRITLIDVPGCEIDRIHDDTAPRVPVIRSKEDWTRKDRMLRKVAKGKDMLKHPPSWTADASVSEWGQK